MFKKLNLLRTPHPLAVITIIVHFYIRPYTIHVDYQKKVRNTYARLVYLHTRTLYFLP